MSETVEYRVYTYPASAESCDITPALISLEWGQLKGEVAGKAVIEIAALDMNGFSIADAVKLNTYMNILADGKTVFSGLIWDYTLESERKIKLICYDKLIYLASSRDNAYYSAGYSTESIVSRICAKWGVPLKYTYMSCTHARINYRALTVAEQITRTLDAARAICGRSYMLRLEGEQLHIGLRGTNSVRSRITEATAVSYSHRLTLDRLVTRVVITTAGSTDGPVKTCATLNGNTSLGIMQDIVSCSGTTLKDARTQAQQLLDERGMPQETIKLVCADIPGLMRGDRVEICAGTLNGEFDVASITHTSAGTMALEVEQAAG